MPEPSAPTSAAPAPTAPPSTASPQPGAPGTAPAPQPSTPTNAAQSPGGNGDGGPSEGFFERYKAATGVDLSSQFDSEEAAFRSMDEARRMVGRRDEAAQEWHRLVDGIPEDRRDEFYTVIDRLKKNEPIHPEPAPTKPPPSWGGSDADWETYSDFERAASRLYDANGQLRQDVDPRFADRIAEVNRKINEAGFAFARDPKAAIEPVVRELIEQAKEEFVETAKTESRTALQQRADQDAIRRIREENAEALFVNGDTNGQLTEFGTKVDAEIAALVEDGMPWGPKVVQRAIKAVQAEMPKPQPSRDPHPRSLARPSTSPARQTMSYADWLGQNPNGSTFQYMQWCEEQMT